MQSLGHSRSAHRDNHILHTPDAFVRAPWPGMKNATAIIHATPTIGAKFTQYTAEFEAGGHLPASHLQRFVYVISGEINTANATLGPGAYAYFGEGQSSQLDSPSGARAVVDREAVSASQWHSTPKPLQRLRKHNHAAAADG